MNVPKTLWVVVCEYPVEDEAFVGICATEALAEALCRKLDAEPGPGVHTYFEEEVVRYPEELE